MPRPRIGVVGSNMVDLIAYAPRMPVIGETLEAPSFEMGFGGKGANQAVAAAKLGASVVMVSKVGDDMFAEGTVNNLASFGIDTTHVHRVKGRSSGVAPIVVDASGRERDPDHQGRQRRSLPGRRRRGGRGAEELRPHPPAARGSARDGLRGDRLRQAPRRQDAAQSRAGDDGARSCAHHRRRLLRAERNGARDPRRHAGGQRGRDRRSRPQPARQGPENDRRHDGRARRPAGDAFLRRAHRAGPDRAGRHDRRGRRLCRRLRALQRRPRSSRTRCAWRAATQPIP